ncbi:hypothetical protein RF11_09596 [Thelohanellus kitauei]|uniref:Uncharacterized protein n=1 Tax=Thelohanellus kitauei TaxID=669202 RepID=A0A0C2IAD3_THEKT|nr:hypothetical protein RF11_09596 [Thelohanellus kitauei]
MSFNLYNWENPDQMDETVDYEGVFEIEWADADLDPSHHEQQYGEQEYSTRSDIYNVTESVNQEISHWAPDYYKSISPSSVATLTDNFNNSKIEVDCPTKFTTEKRAAMATYTNQGLENPRKNNIIDYDNLTLSESLKEYQNFDNVEKEVLSTAQISQKRKRIADQTPLKKLNPNQSQLKNSGSRNVLAHEEPRPIQKHLFSETDIVNNKHEQNFEKLSIISDQMNDNASNVSTSKLLNGPNTYSHDSITAHNAMRIRPNTIRMHDPNFNATKNSAPVSTAPNIVHSVKDPAALNTRGLNPIFNSVCTQSYLMNPAVVANHVYRNNNGYTPQNVVPNIPVVNIPNHLQIPQNRGMNNSNPYMVKNSDYQYEPPCPVTPNTMYPHPGTNSHAYMNSYPPNMTKGYYGRK